MRIRPEALRLETLVDEQATRARVIEKFRQHLGQAGKYDSALFFYAGHGSQESSPEQFWAIEPDRLDETLVLWDSRQPSQWDLADKELAALIYEVASKQAHVAVVLDCCHSGSGTRAPGELRTEKVRRAPRDTRNRQIESFLPLAQQAAARLSRDSGWDLGEQNRHILLAACRDDQESSEYTAAGRKRGAFSYFLLEALRKAPGLLTYRDLAATVRACVALSVPNQTPQVEVTDDADLDRPFLGGAIQPRAKGFLVSQNNGEWLMDGGRIHGVPPPAGEENASVALFDADAAVADMMKVSQAVALAAVVEVKAGHSRIQITRGELAPDKTYKAVLIAIPLPARHVRVTGVAARVATAQAAMAGSMFLMEATAEADFHLECTENEYRLRRGADERMMAAPARTAEEAVLNLEHIAQWISFAELENPGSTITDEEFEVKLFAGRSGNQELTGTDLRLTAMRIAKGLTAQEFRLRFANHGNRDLYFGLLAMDELFQCSTSLIQAGVVKLSPGQEAWALDGKAIKSQIPAALRAEGRTESRDILKLIVSTADFDVRHATLDPLGPPRGRRGRGPKATVNTLERLLARQQSRTISAASEDDEIEDFRTRTVLITTVEPRVCVDVSGIAAADVGAGVRIDPHPALRAQARLTTLGETRSDLGNMILPPLFREEEAGETVHFTASRGSAPSLAVLELNEVSNYDDVTPEVPLVVHLPVTLQEDEVLLPVAYDGEDYLVLGRATVDGGGTVVHIARLPYPVANRTRSLTGSIKILFQKFASPVLGSKYDYPILATAEWDDKGKVNYDKDNGTVKAKVAKAQRVIVFVHGIIGDTTAMGARLKPGPHDVFLTFDYENLHTTIEENAEGLQARLTAVGLGKGHQKEVILIAHSMGGLVSRWFVEKLDGHQVVSRVILCGTPNAGSPWSTAEDWVTGIASLALNYLTKISWEGRVIGYLFKGLEKIDNSLDEMKPGSPFLQRLAKLGDPRIPYTILAGNTSLASAADGERVRRLLKKVLHRTASVAFLFEPNDVAVSVTSIESVDGVRTPRPDNREVACDHMSYFSSEASLQELRALLR